MQANKPECQGCAVNQGYVPVETLSTEIKEPPAHSMSMYASKDDMMAAVTRENEELRAQLAAVQQGVQPYAVLVFERGEEGPFDRKPVKPDSVQHMHAKRDPHYDYVELYTHPTQQGLDAQGMYYLQDARWSAMVGNCPSFWREGGNGYTTNLNEAGRFTFEDAMTQHRCRETDLPWLCAEVDKLRRPTVDCQYMPRNWDEQRAALAAQAKQVEQANG